MGSEVQDEENNVFSVSSERIDSRSVVRIGGELDLTVTEPLKAALREAVADGVDTVEIDATEVSFVDSVGLALLLAFQVNAPKEGLTFRVVGASKQFAHVVKLAGLDDALLPPDDAAP